MSDLIEVDQGKSVEINNKNPNVVDKITDLLKQISITSTTLDPRYVWKSLRELVLLRSYLRREKIFYLIQLVYPENSIYKASLLEFIDNNYTSPIDEVGLLRSNLPADFYQLDDSNRVEVSAEVNSFIHLLVQIILLDTGMIKELVSFNTQIVIPNILNFYNNRNLDLINAKLWFYISRAHEISGNFQDSTIRADMMKFLKTATIKHDSETRAMLITLILRNCLACGEIDTASDFINKVEFPPTNDVSSPLEARYYFYLSKINAIQLDYSRANEYVIAAIRKAPTTINSLGFLQQANKLHCAIQLLMGDIPELSFFRQRGMEQSLEPYYHLSKAVKLGDLKKFASSISKYKSQLIQDGNYQLCVRLRSNVIKTGIGMISLTYRKISLRDICLKLHLDSEQTAEYMVSRAIRDGVIEAKINHEQGHIETTELLNVYSTKQPQQVFDERIRFVNQLHDESVMAMRYPDSRDKNKQANTNDDDLDVDFDIMDLSDYGSDIEDLL